MSSPHLPCVPEKVSDSLREAEALCDLRRGKLTPLRRQILTMLLEAGRPIKAYDLLQRIRGDGEAKPPTVYRTLDFLIEMGLVHRIESLNAFAACGHWKHGHSAVFLICNGCGSVAELHTNDGLKKLGQEAASVSFKMKSAVVELRGLCASCS